MTTATKIIECPRDAMQGVKRFIPTDLKVQYLNALLRVGFDTLDFGSFVSPKSIPQMADTAQVLERLDLDGNTRLLAIVANERGVEEAVVYDAIAYLGFPLSVSGTFQKRNTNRTIDQAFEVVAFAQEHCERRSKELVVYLSMAFGNPYGDVYDVDIIEAFVSRLGALGVGVVSLADTVGLATPTMVKDIFATMIPKFPHVEFGAHLHALPDQALDKVQAALDGGCRRIDGALGGFGGCPMAADELVGNVDTKTIVKALGSRGWPLHIQREPLGQAEQMAGVIF